MTDEPKKESIANSFELVFEEHPEYFFVGIESDSLNPQIMNEYQGKIAREISIRPQYKRVMIKRDVPISHGAGELCALIYNVRGWQVRQIRYAFVDADPSRLPSYRFALLYAMSNGVRAEVFEDISSAEDWLLS